MHGVWKRLYTVKILFGKIFHIDQSHVTLSEMVLEIKGLNTPLNG